MKQTKEQIKARMAKARAARTFKPKAKVVAAEPPKPESDTLAGPSVPPPHARTVEPEIDGASDLFEDAPEGVAVEAVGSLFPAPSSVDVIPMRPDDGIPPLDTGLTADEKKEFIALIDKNMGAAERASRLCDLARLRGTKTAAVGLRAIQEIHTLKKMHDVASGESAPLFVLPADTKVAVLVQKVEK